MKTDRASRVGVLHKLAEAHFGKLLDWELCEVEKHNRRQDAKRVKLKVFGE